MPEVSKLGPHRVLDSTVSGSSTSGSDDSCPFWCTEFSCAASQCKVCSVCGANNKPGCAGWCNRFTRFLDECKSCNAKSGEVSEDTKVMPEVSKLGPHRVLDSTVSGSSTSDSDDSCPFWCTEFSCAASQCKVCSVCSANNKPGCAGWCNRFTRFLDECKSCNAKSGEVSED